MYPPADGRRPGAILFQLLLITGALAAQAPPPEVAAPSAPAVVDARSAGSVTLVLDEEELLLSSIAGSAGPLFALEPVAEKLGLVPAADPSDEGRTIDVGGSLVTLQTGSATITVGQEIVTLSQAVLALDGHFYVPVDFFERSFAELLGLGVAWRPDERRLIMGRGALRTLTLRVQQVHWQGVTTVALELDEAQRYRVERRPETSAIEIVFPGQRLSVEPFARSDDDPLVRRLAILGDRVRLDLSPGAGTDSYELREPFRIVVDVQRGGGAGAEAPGITLRPTVPKAAPSIETIVIDPGHGGDETGALGTRGSAEKDLTLELARALRDRLRGRLPVRVALTRDEDETLSLTARSALANQYRADLFVSIHLNSSLGSTAQGAETYFLSIEASDERAAAAAASENAVTPGAGAVAAVDGENELEFLLWDLAQSRHLARSQRVAMLIQEELNQALGLRDRGVKQAPFRVLMGANMPAVLIELGFLSNPEEEAKLKDSGYRDALVEALVRAIGRYRAELLPAAPIPAQAPASSPAQSSSASPSSSPGGAGRAPA